jgi:hypothetical protein
MGKRREVINGVRPPEGGRTRRDRGVLLGGWRLGALAVLALVACGRSFAAEGEDQKRHVIPLAISVSLYRPFNGTTRDRFGDTWFGISGGVLSRRYSNRWRFTFEAEYRQHEDIGKATLIPVTFGVAHALGKESKAGWLPFVTLRAGPYYGKVKGDRLPSEDDTVGFNTNVSVGVVYRGRYSLSLRYDYFSRFASTNFDGLTLRAAVRVLDLKL